MSAKVTKVLLLLVALVAISVAFVRYNKVTLSLSTHDAGGLTAKDFQFAQCVDDGILSGLS